MNKNTNTNTRKNTNTTDHRNQHPIGSPCASLLCKPFAHWPDDNRYDDGGNDNADNHDDDDDGGGGGDGGFIDLMITFLQQSTLQWILVTLLQTIFARENGKNGFFNQPSTESKYNSEKVFPFIDDC